MPRPSIFIPNKDLKGLETLIKEKHSLKEMSDYYKNNGIIINEKTLSDRIIKLISVNTELKVIWEEKKREDMERCHKARRKK